MSPVEGLCDQRHGAGAAAAEQDGADRYAFGIIPFRGDHRALGGADGEAGIGMGGGIGALGRPGTATPVGQLRGLLVGQTFPPDVAVGRQGDVGEDHVLVQGLDGVLVGADAGARRDAEEAGFRIDRIETAVVAEAHPADVVAHRLGFPAVDGRLQHRQVGLAAGAGEGRRHEPHLALGRGQLEDQHVLGQPALVAGHDAGDAQGVALLAEQGVAAVARAVGPDLAGLGVVDDPLVVVAGPGNIGLAGAQRRAQRVNGRHEEAVLSHHVQSALAHAGHDPHRDGDIGAVGDLNTQGADRRAERAHAERDDVHRPAAHAAVEQIAESLTHLDRIGPVVGRAGVGLVLRADEGAALDPGDVARIRGGIEAVGALFGVQPRQGAGLAQLRGQGLPLGVGAVAPVDPVGLGEGGDILDPRNKTRVFRGGLVKALDGFSTHHRRSYICRGVPIPGHLTRLCGSTPCAEVCLARRTASRQVETGSAV